MVKEATFQTDPTTGYVWLPVRNPKPVLDIKYIEDKGIRGLGAELYGVYQGVEHQKFSYDLDVYATDFWNIIPGILGNDTKTGTAAPYTHTFNLAAAEPKSYSVRDYDGADEYVFTGSRFSELTFKLDSEGALTSTLQGMGAPQVSAGGPDTPTFSSDPYYLGWQATVSIAGSPNYHLVTASLSLKRKVTPRWSAQNSQNPAAMFAGALTFDGSITFDVEGDTEYNYYVNNTQPVVLITLAQPGSSNTVAFQMSKCAFTTGAKTSGKDWLQVDAKVQGVYNATDAGPGEIIVQNAQSTAY